MEVDYLERIQRVETPPFLFTRIQERVKQIEKDSMPKYVSLAINVSFLLLLTINVIVLVNYPSKQNVNENLAKSMNLISNNSLY
jgi:hypothetical protein